MVVLISMISISVKKLNQSINLAHLTGIIYRNESLVNWCCELQSTISDIEVAHVEAKTRTFFEIPGYRYVNEADVLYMLNCICSDSALGTTFSV